MKKEVILYIAASQDGYIADKEGKLDFLPEIPDDGYDYGYKEMYDSVDVIIMGRTTYDYITDWSPAGEWPYADKVCYVYTHQSRLSEDNIRFTNDEPEVLLQKIYSEGFNRVWIMGGGEIIRLFLQKDLIDIFDLFYVPVLLGDGIPLFPPRFPLTSLVLEKIDTRGGMVETIYRRK